MYHVDLLHWLNRFLLPVQSKLLLVSCIHPTFHVSQLKKHTGKTSVQSTLPVVGANGAMLKEPACILERCMVKRGNQTVIEVLVEWTNTFPEDAT